MNKVFLYATLLHEKILETALGEHHGKPLHRASLKGYIEQPVHYDHESWPNLWAMGATSSVDGDIIDVTDDELAKLDKWESNYHRRQIQTSIGPAWVFLFQRPGLKASIGEVARWR